MTGSTLPAPTGARAPQRIAATLLLAAALFAASFAAPLLHAQDDGPAFPPLDGRVVDAANLLDESTERALTDSLAAHEEASSDQVVVATVPSLDGYDIADYANRLGRAWGIGTAENDNGVVLLVAPNEREVRIEVGYGLEGALTDALSSTIIRREILPAFRANDYARGIEAGVASILAAIDGEYTAPATDGTEGGSGSRAIDQFVPLIFIAVIAIPQLLRRGGARRAANGAFPAGFAGLVGALVSGSVLIGILVAVGLFLLIYLGGGGKGGGGGKRGGRRRRRIPGVIVGGGGFGGGLGGGGFGGGFGGGGGSFGGGGASGSW